jgi:two-component system, chemotaxis family, response regulator Rcp1
VGLVREALEEHGVQGDLLVITDGDKAIRYIEALENQPANCPDLFIVDLKLPKRSGHEVMRSVRQSVKCRDATVVILSSSDVQEDKDESIRLGANRYIRKPLGLDDFLNLGAVFKAMLEAPSSLA